MRHRNALIALLAVQAILVALSWGPGEGSASRFRPLLDLEADAVTALRITAMPPEGADPTTVALEREGDGWVVTSAGGYPAITTKVDELVDELVALEIAKPIAKQESSHNQLKVGEKEYGKRIEVETAAGTTTLVLGAAARDAVNVRFADANEVYTSRGLSEWSIPADDASFYDTSYVDIPLEEITTVSLTNGLGTLDFSREGETWRLAQLPEGASLDSDAVDALLEDVAELEIVTPVGREEKPEHGLDAGLSVTWTIEDEDQSRGGSYRVGKTEGSEAFVKAAASPFVVKVAASAVSALEAAEVSGLTRVDAVPEPEDGQSEGAGTVLAPPAGVVPPQ